jgi:hypothetical protein
LKNIESELGDIDPKLKRSIILEIREHLNEKIEDIRSSKNIPKLSPKQIEIILNDFGEPKEISNEYRRQLSEERITTRRKKESPKRRIIVIIIFIFLMSSILIPIFNILWISDDDGDDNDDQDENIIYPGHGLVNIKIGDDLDKIKEEFGEPEEIVDTDQYTWVSYNVKLSIDFLINKTTTKIKEIRFNTGFTGQLENGISFKSNLNDVLNSSGGALNTIQVNYTDYQQSSSGYDRVLYELVDENSIVTNCKFIDSKQGILYWFDSDKKVSQIVVFRAF